MENIVELFRQKKMSGRKLATLTAYDYPMGRLLDELDLDFILVGDSLGMVVLGHPDTTEVTLGDMVHHTKAVARGVTKTLLVADLSAHSADFPEEAVKSAKELIAAGAQAVKIEGGSEIVPIVKAILAEGIPVLGHIGMLPQRVREEGGYKIKGKTPQQADRLLEDARALSEAGVFGIVAELVSPPSPSRSRNRSRFPLLESGVGRVVTGKSWLLTISWGFFRGSSRSSCSRRPIWPARFARRLVRTLRMFVVHDGCRPANFWYFVMPMRALGLLLLLLLPLSLNAELPPSAYDAMQKKAGEYLNIEVLRVDIEPGENPNEQRCRSPHW